MADDVPPDDGNKKGSRHFWQGLAFSAVVLAFLIVRLSFPVLFERFDLISLGLLAIAALPWLSTFIEEFEIAGLFSAKFRDIERKLEEGLQEAKQHAEDTSQNMLLATPTTIESQPADATTADGLEKLADTDARASLLDGA